jgi:acyl-CoA synthetase (AMP-forming)/AMP-acid ligase II
MINLTEHCPDQPAIIHDGVVWTYSELHRRSVRVAKNLTDLDLEPGDRIATLLPNCHELVVLYLAAHHGGFTIVPLDARYNEAQINFALRHTRASVLVTHSGQIDEVAECEALNEVSHVYVVGAESHEDYTPFNDLVTRRATADLSEDVTGNDVSIVFYTSGTTARPHGVTLTRDAIASGVSKCNAVMRLRPDDVTLIAGPISRSMALRTQLLPSLAAGATVILTTRFDPDLYVRTLRNHPDTTFISLLPSAMRRIVFHDDLKRTDLGSVRLAICGGDHVPVDVFEKFNELTGFDLTQQCGMTETGMYAANPPYGRKKRCSIGLPYYGVQISIIDNKGNDLPWGEAGEIAVRSPFAMDGYWNETAATRRVMRHGWIRTGDIGRIDDDGFLWLDGRKKDIIIRGGSNISPAAIEAALQHHPSVKEACVVGVDDPEMGQAVCAFVTLTDSASIDRLEDEVRAVAERELPEYMVPQSICALPKMPRTGSGKVDRTRLKWIAESSDDETLAVLLDWPRKGH